MKSLLLSILFILLTSNVFAFDDFLVKSSPVSVDGAKTVSSSEAKALFDKGVPFVDVRSSMGYNKGRIPNALFLDLKRKFTKEALIKEVRINEPVVIYCQGLKCKRAAIAVKKALSWGYTKVYYYRHGFPGWKKEGYAVESD